MEQPLKIMPAVPSQYVSEPLSSTSAHVLRRRYETILPKQSATSYSYNGNNRLEFLIDSNTDFWDFSNSFIKFDLTTTLSIDGSSDATRNLATGGAHAFFRRVYVESSNGVNIQTIERYNKLYAIHRCALPADYVENTLWGAGDSVGKGADYSKYGVSAQPTREYVANTNDVVLSFQPMLPVFLTGVQVPLPFIRGGVNIYFELEDPSYVLNSETNFSSTGYTNASYTISNPRYICAFTQPSQEVMASYRRMFENGGINISYLGYRYFNEQVNAGSSGLKSYQLQTNVRSARSIYTVIQAPTAETVSAADDNVDENTFRHDSIGEFIKANLSEFQFYSGSLRFPTSRNVDMTDPSNSEALQYFLDTQDKQGSSMFQLSVLPDEWAERSTVNGNTDSRKLVIASKLARDSDSYAGLDLSNQPLNVDLNFDAVYQVNSNNAIRYIHNWIEYDSTLNISSSGLTVRN